MVALWYWKILNRFNGILRVTMPKRSSITITKSRVDALTIGQQLWDAGTIGFGVVANAHSKTFKLKYRYKGRQRMLTIGRYGPLTVDAARKQAITYLAELNANVDPATKKVNLAFTVADLCNEYMQKHAKVTKKASSAAQDASNIKNHLKPLLGKMAVADVTSKEIDEFKIKVETGKTAPTNPKDVQKAQKGGSPVRGGKGVANRCLALLSKMFNLAEKWGYRPQRTNPTVGISKYRENAKERYLSDEELKNLWSHLDRMEAEKGADVYAIAFFRLLILTGARSSEIRTLKWSSVDLSAKRLILSDSKTGKKTIHLSDVAVGVLEALPQVTGNGYVIVGAKLGKPLQNVRKPWVAIRKAVGLDDVRLHDLRHSFASFAAAQGMPLKTIGALMGHLNDGTTSRYVHLTDQYLQKANDELGARMKGVVGGRTEPLPTEDQPKQ
ncbi:tyrosine-type recombinase/integrase [Mesorhizobium microcysteis]|uniref:Tyrosine-type recombinase/integrase n=1 Tax=Neoaquamicrobium microcysteis TaxID=2682781 RepID=A0A5D4H2M1_9HYPH|nr:site-specific integrase [Mesorhizobium microcysteis]TYR34888.1 tyrosine-type recombinase/integrase [Mesorhizobium microcysteis]